MPPLNPIRCSPPALLLSLSELVIGDPLHRAAAGKSARHAPDPNSASQQELLSAAKDADLRQGTHQDLTYASGFEELSTALHTGDKQNYVNLLA